MIVVGLLRKLAIDATNTAVEALAEKIPSASAQLEKLKAREHEFSGKVKHKVYTYDGTPLSGLRKGRAFYSTVIIDPAKVGRLLYGEKLEDDDDSIALAYKGKPYGTFSSFNDIFHEMISKGYTIRVKTKIVGMYDVGIPQVIAYMPERDEVELWREACNELGREVPFSNGGSYD